jgi:hypothetical protein
MGRFAGRENPFDESRRTRLAKRALLIFILVHIPIGAMSSYRAWVQVRALSVTTSGPVLSAGSWLRADVVTSGRQFVDYGIELEQGARNDTLGYHIVRKNRDPFYDQRTRRDSLVITLTDAMLAPFVDGPAVVRSRALGGPQWMRTPPPTVREMAVTIRKTPR